MERPDSTFYLELSTAYTDYAAECLAATHRFTLFDGSCSKQLTGSGTVIDSEQATSYNELPALYIKDTFLSVWASNRTLQSFFDLSDVDRVDLCMYVEIVPTVVSTTLSISGSIYARTVSIEVAEAANTIAELSEPAPTFIDFESKEIELD